MEIRFDGDKDFVERTEEAQKEKNAQNGSLSRNQSHHSVAIDENDKAEKSRHNGPIREARR